MPGCAGECAGRTACAGYAGVCRSMPGTPGAPGAPGTPGALGAGRIREKTRTCAHALRLILPSSKEAAKDINALTARHHGTFLGHNNSSYKCCHMCMCVCRVCECLLKCPDCGIKKVSEAALHSLCFCLLEPETTCHSVMETT